MTWSLKNPLQLALVTTPAEAYAAKAAGKQIVFIGLETDMPSAAT